MSLRKINNSDTDFVFSDGYSTIDVEITKEGIKVDYDADILTWEQISKARDAIGLVSFTDEEFEKWAKEHNYMHVDEVKRRIDQISADFKTAKRVR